MIGHAIKVISIGGYLSARVVKVDWYRALSVNIGRKWWWHVVCEIQRLQRKVNKSLQLVCEWALRSEPFEVN